MKTKIIYLILPMLFFPSIGYCQQLSSDKEIIKWPTFKDELFQVAVYNYIYNELDLSNVVSPSMGLSDYTPKVSFSIKSNGSLKTAKIIQSTGSKWLDNKVLMLCKDFVRKKFMTPAYSENGPVECYLTVTLGFRYYSLSKNNSGPIRYLSGGHSMYSKWTDLYTPSPYDP